MKTTQQFYKHFLVTLLLTAFVFTSCTKSDDANLVIPTTAEAFNAIQEEALESITQNFQFNAEDGSTTFTSQNGVTITINGSCLTKNGDAVTGAVDLEFVEIFDKATMLMTNKPTMGLLPNGDKALLISGGEFYVNATQNGVPLETTCDFQLIVPTALTGGTDNDMILWNGTIDENGNLAWKEDDRDGAAQGGLFVEGNNYYAFIGDFGWSNVDRFYNDPRPKTTILVDVPEGYNNTNSAVYLSYDSEDSGLANLDTYDTTSGLFSEHYGQIPVGLECHVIFISEENGNWKYAIKPVTIFENGIITINEGETAIATEAQLTTIINGLP